MKRKIFQFLVIVLIFTLVGGVAGFGQKASAALAEAPDDSQSPTATTIIVTSTLDDYTDGHSKTCLNASPCTLRRAINQAYSAGDRPVTIEFNIPTTDSGYNAALGIWKIQVNGSSSYDFRELYGATTVDGTTQPGGRTNGPKIVVDGRETHNYGFKMYNGGNEVHGLAMQNFKTAHVSVASSNNLIADNWFGLSDNGMTLTSGSDGETTEGGGGVAMAAGGSGNTVRDNVFAGFFGAAVAVRGNNAVLTGNWIGTRGDGTVPIPAQFNKHPCLSGAWVGGTGITVSGNNHQIGGPNPADGNIFAGLFHDISSTSIQSPAIDVSGDGEGHIIQNNVIGIDAAQNLVGVCGRGMDFANGPKDMWVEDNTIVETGLSGIVMNSPFINGNTLRGNIIKRATNWPSEQGFNDFPEDAISYGMEINPALRSFKPAAITDIDGVTVTGTSGANSACGSCVVEVFLDDTDTITETLQSLAVVTAAANGSWMATLAAPLESGQCLRTMSTVPDSFTIIGLDPGTTSNLSELYGCSANTIYLPLVIK